MKKITTLLVIILTALMLLTQNTYSIDNNQIIDDPGSTKWGLYHQQSQINNESVYSVNLRIHIGSTYSNFTFNTGLRFGTIRNYSQGIQNGTYLNFASSSAQYGDDDWQAYDFTINSPEGYSELVIQSKLPSASSWTTRYTGVSGVLDIQSAYDILSFRSDGTGIYNSTMDTKVGYFESTEIFRIWYQPSASDIESPIEEPSEEINITDFNDLPVTEGFLVDANKPNKTGIVKFTFFQGNQYDVKIHYRGVQYNLGILALPGVNELQKEPLDGGVYYTQSGMRYIYYEFQLPASERPINQQVNMFIDNEDNIKGFRPFVSMNLTDQNYVFTDKLNLYAAWHDGGQGKAYADVLFPMNLDDLLAIEIQYQYKWKSFFPWWDSEWITTEVSRYKNEAVDMRTTWQHIVGWMTPYHFYFEEVPSWFTGNNPTITEVTNPDTTYKNRYLDIINTAQEKRNLDPLTMNQLFDDEYSLYRVYLNTFNDGRYTGYEIHDDIIILSVTYQYKGNVYHVPYEDIEVVTGGGSSEDPLDGIENKIQTLIDGFNNILMFVNTHWNTFVIVGIVIIGIIVVLTLLFVIASFTKTTRYVMNTFNDAFSSTTFKNSKVKPKYSSKSNTPLVLLLFLSVTLIIIAVVLMVL